MQMLQKLICHFILHFSTGISQCLLSQGVSGDEYLCGIPVLGKKKVGEGKAKRDFVQLCILKRIISQEVYFTGFTVLITDFLLQSALFFFPFPFVSAFISFLIFCFLFTLHCHFDVCASFRWIFFVCSNKILYPRCHLSGRFHCRHRVQSLMVTKQDVLPHSNTIVPCSLLGFCLSEQLQQGNFIVLDFCLWCLVSIRQSLLCLCFKLLTPSYYCFSPHNLFNLYQAGEIQDEGSYLICYLF